jgi:transcriptional repressor NrdR
LRNKYTADVPSRAIGEVVMARLKQMDKVAYIRFASVYRNFTDLGSFEKELKELQREPPLARKEESVKRQEK